MSAVYVCAHDPLGHLAVEILRKAGFEIRNTVQELMDGDLILVDEDHARSFPGDEYRTIVWCVEPISAEKALKKVRTHIGGFKLRGVEWGMDLGFALTRYYLAN